MEKIIFAPTRRFQEISERPVWTLPLILTIVVPALLATLTGSLIPRDRLIASVENRIARTRAFIDEQVAKGKMPSEGHAAAVERIEEVSRSEVEFYSRAPWIKLFVRFLIRSVPALVWSGLQLLIWTTILNLFLPVLGGAASFRRVLAITTNSGLLRIPAALVHAILLFATGNPAASTSLAPLAPGAPVYLRGVLAGIDIFTIWELALTGLGLGVVFRLNKKVAFAVVFGIWFAYVLVLAGMVALSGGLALG